MPELVRTTLDAAELTEANLLGAPVFGQNDFEIGEVVHLNDLGYEVEVVVECGPLFDMESRPVALPASEIDVMRDDKGNVFVTIERTKDEIMAFAERRL